MRRRTALLVGLIMLIGAFAGCVEETKKKNKPPEVMVNISSENVTAGENVTFDASATKDPDKKDTLTYLWHFGDGTSSTKKVVNHTYIKPGKYVVTLTVSDGKHTVEKTWNITVSNAVPVITDFSPKGDITINEWESVNFTVNATDANDNSLSYTWYLDDLKTGIETPKYTYTTDAASAGTHKVMVVVSDSYGANTTHTWNVTVMDVNTPPTILSKTPSADTVSMLENSLQSFSVTAVDQDGDTLTYTWTLDGTTVGENNSYFEYTPGSDSAGNHTLIVTVSDGKGGENSTSWTIDVANVNQPPVIDSYSPEGDVVLDEGDSQTFHIEAHDNDGDPITYKWKLDGFVVLSGSSTFLFVTNLSSSGEHVVTGLASDGKSASTHTWNVTVNNVNQAPYITARTPETDPTVEENHTLEFHVACIDPDGDDISYQWALDGTNLSSETSSSYTYLPGYEDAGTHTVAVYVSDGTAVNSTSWTVTVTNVNRPPVVQASVSFQNVGIGLSVTFTGNGTTDPDGDTLTYAWDFGDGKTASGKVATHAYSSPGIYTAKLTATDALGASANATVQVNVNITQTHSTTFEYGSVVDTGDIDNDGTTEIVVGTRSSTGGFVYVFDGSSYSQEWKSNNIGAVTTLLLANLDNDAALEIVVGVDAGTTGGNPTYYHGYVYVFDGSSHNQEFQSADIGSVNSIAVGNVNGGNTKEFVAGTVSLSDTSSVDFYYNGNLTVFSGGSTIQEETRLNLNNTVCVWVEDMNADGTKDIIVGTRDSQDYSPMAFHGSVLVIRYQGGIYTVTDTNHNVEWISSMVVSDVDRDTVTEVLVGTFNGIDTKNHGFLTILSNDLSEEWKGSTDYGEVSIILVEDMDNDNTNEIVFGANVGTYDDPLTPGGSLYEGYVYVINGVTHQQKWKSQNISKVVSIALSDVNSDNTMDILVGTITKMFPSGTMDGYLILYDGSDYSEIWKSTNIGGVTSLSTGDFDGDGYKDIAVAVGTNKASGNGKLLVYSNKNS